MNNPKDLIIRFFKSRSAYNTPLMFEIEGTLNLNALEKALDCFVNEYDEGCRTTFEESNDEVFRVIHDYVPLVQGNVFTLNP